MTEELNKGQQALMVLLFPKDKFTKSYILRMMMMIIIIVIILGDTAYSRPRPIDRFLGAHRGE